MNNLNEMKDLNKSSSTSQLLNSNETFSPLHSIQLLKTILEIENLNKDFNPN